MQDSGYTTSMLHDTLDRNKDGGVDKEEFVTGMSMLGIAGLQQKDYISIFEAIDVDSNMHLSLNEFSLYL